MIENIFNLKGKVALVTGGARGIGAMITQGLIESGVKVYISSRSADALIAFAEKMNNLGKGECVPIPMDLSKTENIDSLAAELNSREKQLDILINNSGATWGAPLGEFPEKGWDKIMDLNVKSVFFLTQALLPMLKTSASKDDPSRVVNISSVAAVDADSISSYSYGPSKAAVMQLTKILARDLIKDQILVNAIGPGLFPSKMTAYVDESLHEKLVPIGRSGRPEDIAGLVIYMCSRAGSFMTGNYVPLDGGFLVRGSSGMMM